jgi:DNA-binding response OmpR family regulator
VTTPHGPATLTALDFDLLLALARHPGHVLTRRQLLQTVWGPDYCGDDRVVDVHIRTLRRALHDDAAKPTYIATIRGIGYRLIAPSRALEGTLKGFQRSACVASSGKAFA